MRWGKDNEKKGNGGERSLQCTGNAGRDGLPYPPPPKEEEEQQQRGQKESIVRRHGRWLAEVRAGSCECDAPSGELFSSPDRRAQFPPRLPSFPPPPRELPFLGPGRTWRRQAEARAASRKEEYALMPWRAVDLRGMYPTFAANRLLCAGLLETRGPPGRGGDRRTRAGRSARSAAYAVIVRSWRLIDRLHARTCVLIGPPGAEAPASGPPARAAERRAPGRRRARAPRGGRPRAWTHRAPGVERSQNSSASYAARRGLTSIAFAVSRDRAFSASVAGRERWKNDASPGSRTYGPRAPMRVGAFLVESLRCTPSTSSVAGLEERV